jgi:hypothetical protein
MSIRIALLLALAVLSVSAQTNAVAPAGQAVASETAVNPGLAAARRYESTREDCIEARRMICGRIIKILPAGLVIESGYTNLMRLPNNQSWLIPGTVVASRPQNLVESNQPDAICGGLIFLADVPKSRGKPKKPKLYDYVMAEGFPIGHYTYTSVGSIQRTVRQFTTNLGVATRWHFNQDEQQNVSTK